jgi:crotonobetainyl-CoA:carnitine CoA-transferase CaiB-like acyl-CoA transferase
VTLDLRQPDGQALLRRLAETADVLVENFRPGTMERFHLDYQVMRRTRPDIVYCSISGFGQTGPMAHRPALDLMVQAVSGLMSLTGEPDGQPMKAAAPVADVMGGFSAVVAIMGALMERQRTGEGRYLDISMLDGLMALMGQAVAIAGMSGKAPPRSGNGHPLASPYANFRCADRDIVIAVTNEKSWASFCKLPEFAYFENDPRYMTQPLRSANRATLLPEVNAIFRSKPATYWLAAFEKLGIPAEPVRGQPTQIINDPNTGERSEIVRNPDGTVKEVRPLPGSKPTGPTTRAPSMPHIVVGEAQNALRTAYDQIQEEVDAGRRTPAWGENRRKEIFQTAQLTVQEANLVENSRQSNQSFAFNVANTKLQYGQGAFESAMRFTLSIIDKLEPGSGTGGKMFAAMLGLSMANRASSGIDDLEIPRGASVGPGRGLDARGSQAERRPPPAPPRLTDPGDPKAVDADLERAKAHPAFQATDTTDANGQPRVMTPSVGVGQGAPLPAAAPAPAPAAPVSTAPAPVVAPGSTPTAPAYVRTDVNGAPAPPQPAPGTETMTIRNKADGRLLEIPRARWPDFQGAYEEMPAPTLPSASPQAMTQPQVPQFAAVEAMMPAPQAPQMPAVDSSGGIQLPALDAAQIAATPPWRLPPDQLDNLVQQYGEQVVFGMPGMGVLA